MFVQPVQMTNCAHGQQRQLRIKWTRRRRQARGRSIFLLGRHTEVENTNRNEMGQSNMNAFPMPVKYLEATQKPIIDHRPPVTVIVLLSLLMCIVPSHTSDVGVEQVPQRLIKSHRGSITLAPYTNTPPSSTLPILFFLFLKARILPHTFDFNWPNPIWPCCRMGGITCVEQICNQWNGQDLPPKNLIMPKWQLGHVKILQPHDCVQVFLQAVWHSSPKITPGVCQTHNCSPHPTDRLIINIYQHR